MRVTLISKPDQRMTGLRRYNDTLSRELSGLGVTVHQAWPALPLPDGLLSATRRRGFDIGAFHNTFPLRVPAPSADIYHLASETLATYLLASRARPSIVTVHAFFSYLLRDQSEHRVNDGHVRRAFDSLAARGLRHADAILAVSEYVKALLIERARIPVERIHVVPEAVDHDVFYPRQVPHSFREQFGLRDDCRYILYVGSEQPRKNVLLLLRAFAQVRERYPDLRLIKIGQPELQSEREKALRLIEQLGIEDAVSFHGHLGDELPLFYSASHLFVFPSLYEGFGFPPLEAMACGTPVICSNTTSLPEVVNDAALLFDPRDEPALVHQLDAILRSDLLHREYRERGLRNARRFNWQTTASETLAIYRLIAARSERTKSRYAGRALQ